MDAVTLAELNEQWMDRVLSLEVAEEQRRFVPSPGGIISRAWVYRAKGSRLFTVCAGDRCVGLALVYEEEDDPACYYLMELMIHRSEQGKGYGTAAARELIRLYSLRPKFPMLELSVDRENAPRPARL